MRILIVNDDGIDAVGIRVLAEAFAKEHEVCVVAPETERSGFSHSVTIFKQMRYAKAEGGGYEAYSISGTPADCVKLAVLYLYPNARPDLVLSGINSGPNLGSDIMYSGTVAAASEAAFLSIPAVAVSLGGFLKEREHFKEREYYTAAAEFVRRNLNALYAAARERKGEMLLSVNYPVGLPYRGATLTPYGLNWYDDYYDETGEAGTEQLKGMPVHRATDEADCDVKSIKAGYASVTPLKLDRNHYEALKELRSKLKLI